MADSVFLPQYKNSILSLSNTILKYYGVASSFTGLASVQQRLKKRPKNIVLWVLDGLGTDLLFHTITATSFLRQHVIQTLSSVFPPTTTAATTTLYSGLPPARHGWIGWAPYFADQGCYVALFSGKNDYTGEQTPVDARRRLPYPHLFDQIRAVRSDVVCTWLPPVKIDQKGSETFSEQGRKIVRQTRQSGEQFIIAYWPDPDHTAHHQGPYSPQTKQVVRELNRVVRRVCQQVKDTLIIVTADHGHVPVEKILWMNDYPDMMACLDKPIGLDDRVSSIFLKPGCRKRFQDLYRQYLADEFMLIPSEEAVQAGLFGPGPFCPAMRESLGDFLLVATACSVLRQRVGEYLSGPVMKSAHAGLTHREMIVPLIMIQK